MATVASTNICRWTDGQMDRQSDYYRAHAFSCGALIEEKIFVIPRNDISVPFLIRHQSEFCISIPRLNEAAILDLSTQLRGLMIG